MSWLSFAYSAYKFIYNRLYAVIVRILTESLFVGIDYVFIS